MIASMAGRGASDAAGKTITVMALLCATLLLAGCSPSTPAPITSVATVADRVICGSGSPEAGRVPKGFIPVVVSLCDFTFVRVPGPTPTPAAPRELRGDLTALLAALAKPNDRIPAHQACPAMMQTPPILWLSDDAGRAIRAAWPRDSCGFTKPAVAAALKVLEKQN